MEEGFASSSYGKGDCKMTDAEFHARRQASRRYYEMRFYSDAARFAEWVIHNWPRERAEIYAAWGL